MRKVLLIGIGAAICVLLIGYVYGFFSHRNNLFPYPQAKLAYSNLNQDYSADQLHGKVEQADFDPNSVPAIEKGLELSTLISERRVLETITVPVLATVIDVGSREGFGEPSSRGPKGGLCSMGSSLVVFDGAGNGLLVEMNSMTIAGHISVASFENELGGEFVRVNDVACNQSHDPTHAYISYEIMYPDATDPLAQYRTVIGRINIQEFQDSPVIELWSSELTGENEAGRMALLSDSQFLITFYDTSAGERQANGLFGPEDSASLMGKVILADASTGGHEIYSSGHRNPQGLFVSSEGWVFETEHGPKGGDELNFVEKGGNYGWNTLEGTHCFSPSTGCDSANTILPIAEHANGAGNCSVTGGYVYRGPLIPELTGVYIYSDFCSGTIWGIRTNDRPAGAQIIGGGIQWIPSFGEDEAGNLYMLSFGGPIRRVVLAE